MSVNLSIKDVPDHIAEKLRKRAARHHRSLQGELMNIVEESITGPKTLSVRDLLKQTQQSGLQTDADATKWIRADRDAR